LPLPHEQGTPQIGRHVRECVVEAEEFVRVGRVSRGAFAEQVDVGRRLDAAASARAQPLRHAHVVGDLVEPGRFELRDDALAHCRRDPQERVLDGVLGLLARSKLADAVAEDPVAVLGVETRRFAIGRVTSRSVVQRL
jgi:hypothetical protein